MPLVSSVYNNYISVIGATSIQGISGADRNIIFGTVDSQYDSVFPLGASVMFDISKAIIIKQTGVQYFLLKSSDVILVETAIVPLP